MSDPLIINADIKKVFGSKVDPHSFKGERGRILHRSLEDKHFDIAPIS